MKLKDFKFRVFIKGRLEYKNFKPEMRFKEDGEEYYQASATLIFGDSPEKLATPMNEAIIDIFTGLQDNRGNDIYEGDILKADVPWEDTELEIIGAVKYNDMGGYYYIDFENDEENSTYLADFKICEIIGNIHENAELLQGDNQNG